MNKAKLVLTSAIVAAISSVQAYTLDTDAQRIGYTIGADMGSTLGEFAGQEDSLSFDALIVGLRDAYQGNDLAMTPEEMDATMQTFAQKRMEQLQQEQTQLQQENLQAGQEFLDANAKKEGIQTTDSGLQYMVLEEGEGDRPSADANVTVEYEGRLIDGTVFDSSENSGQPVTFNVNEVIDGWVEGLQLMKEGGKYRLFIPAELAYGEMGAGPSIPPNSTLIFDVELLEINSDTNAMQTEDKSVDSNSDGAVSNENDVAAATLEEAKANAEQAKQDAKQIAENVSNEAQELGAEMDAAVQDAQAQAQEGIEEVERETADMVEAAEQEVEATTEDNAQTTDQVQTNSDAIDSSASTSVAEPEAEVIIDAEPANVGENAQAVELQAQEADDANNSLQEMAEHAATEHADVNDGEMVDAEADEKNVFENALEAAGEGIEDATNAISETVSDAADAITGEDK